MEYYISIFILNIIVDLILLLSIKNIFGLSVRKICLLFLEIFNLCNLSIYLFLELKFYQFILGKILVNLILTLLITDDYKFKKLCELFFMQNVLMFSYYGFYEFLILLSRAVIFENFCKKLPIICDICILFAFLCYIFAVFALVSKLSKIKKIKSLLSKVSFLAFGRHIEIMGLLDSGNVLRDTKTNLPVIIINVRTIKNYLSKKDYENIIKGDYSKLNFSHYLKVVTISKEETEIPIIIPKSVVIGEGKNLKIKRCALGFVSHDFENSNAYGCLLHRDFI